jgi:hypothetical protein
MWEYISVALIKYFLSFPQVLLNFSQIFNRNMLPGCLETKLCVIPMKGHAVAQMVSCHLPNVVAQVNFKSGHLGFFFNKVAVGHHYGFPNQFLIH